MKILIDNGLNTRGTGIAAYSAYLKNALSALPDTEVVAEDFAPKGGKIRRRLSYLRYLAGKQYRKKLAKFDVVHYTNYAMPKKLPQGVISAVTVHDLTAFIHPETLSKPYAAYNRRMVRRAVRHADILFTVSHTVAEEIAARFPAAKEKITVVYPGHYTDATQESPAASYENEALKGLEKKKFFLFIGTLEARKNLTELVRAYSILVERQPVAAGYALVLAGGFGRGANAIVNAVLDAPDKADIRVTGYVSNADRTKLLHDATALIFPSCYEGFGSPQTEAMAAGLPMILSDIPTNREVSGDLALYYPVGDPDLLAKSMELTLLGLHRTDREKYAARLARFNWQSAAESILAAYKTKFQ